MNSVSKKQKEEEKEVRRRKSGAVLAQCCGTGVHWQCQTLAKLRQELW